MCMYCIILQIFYEETSLVGKTTCITNVVSTNRTVLTHVC